MLAYATETARANAAEATIKALRDVVEEILVDRMVTPDVRLAALKIIAKDALALTTPNDEETR